MVEKGARKTSNKYKSDPLIIAPLGLRKTLVNQCLCTYVRQTLNNCEERKQ